jgi:hypothetical protein
MTLGLSFGPTWAEPIDVNTDNRVAMPAVDNAVIQLTSRSPRPPTLKTANSDWAKDLMARSLVKRQKSTEKNIVETSLEAESQKCLVVVMPIRRPLTPR